MKYRKKLDLIADILNAAIKGAKKTHIMYSGNLSFTLLNYYLKIVTDSGLLLFNSNNRSYFTTKKGAKFLNIYNNYIKEVQATEKIHQLLEVKKTQLEKMFTITNSNMKF